MKTAIVTGANGFIGSAVVKELLEQGYSVYAVVRSHDAKYTRLPYNKNCKLIVCSLTDIKGLPELIEENVSGSLFFHFAWQGSAGPDRGNTDIQLKNIQWTLDCIKVAKELGCSRFIGAGSIMEKETLAAVYSQGNKPGTPYIYGASKVTAHAFGKALAASLNLDFIWTFITNAYGAGEFSPRLVNSTLKKCINQTEPEFTAGTQNYDFIYISDVALAYRLIGEKGYSFHEYVIGSGNPKPLKNFLLEMQHSVAPSLEFKFGNVPFTGVNLSLEDFSTELTVKHTKFKPQISFEEGCRLTFNWLKEVSQK